MIFWRIYIKWIFFTLKLRWSLRPYRCHQYLEIQKGSLLPNAKSSQFLNMVNRTTKHCQMLQVRPISSKCLNRSFFAFIAYDSVTDANDRGVAVESPSLTYFKNISILQLGSFEVTDFNTSRFLPFFGIFYSYFFL